MGFRRCVSVKYLAVIYVRKLSILVIIFIALNIIASKKLSEMSKQDREAKLESVLKDFQQKFPEIEQMTKNLSAQSIAEIQKNIDKNIDATYRPLYGQIDNFSGFHYSVTGEYSELLTVVFGKVESILQDKLFNPVKFDRLLNNAIEKTNNDSLAILKKQLSKMKSEVQDSLNLNSDEVEFLFDKILNITQKDMKNRFLSVKNNLFKGTGIGAGMIMSKIISKNIAKVLSKKIATKIAIKSGTKLASAGVGAAAGAESGLLCGPGAWLCSPAGAIVGGIVGLFATDKIVVEIDQYYNEEDFKTNIKKLIDQQKNATKNTLSSIYTNSFKELSNENKNKLEEIKSKQMKDIIVK